MATKICSDCYEEKDTSLFHKDNHKKDGLYHHCKECRSKYLSSDKVLQNRRKRYDKKSEYILAQNKVYFEKNKHKYKKYNEVLTEEQKEHRKEMKKKWIEQNQEKIKASRKTYKAKRSKIPIFHLSRNISYSIWFSLKGKKDNKHWEVLVGYTAEQLKEHLEKQFQTGMSWKNYGKWHIDHIIPISFFQFYDYNDVEFKMCWRLENLQPLWAKENLIKNNKVPAGIK